MMIETSPKCSHALSIFDPDFHKTEQLLFITTILQSFLRFVRFISSMYTAKATTRLI